MLISYLRALSGKERSASANFHLALFLAFVAGAINANGFFAVKKYTAHMTGIITTMADSIVVGQSELTITGLCALIFFITGAGCSAILICRANQRHLQSEYALPFMLEAWLIFLFGLLGDSLQAYPTFFMPVTITVLCFVMGLQNATVTKMSNGQIRTTHITGLVTDLGSELGKLLYAKLIKQAEIKATIPVDLSKLKLLLSLLSMFFIGGIVGTLSFMYIGFTSIFPLGILLAVCSLVPMLEDLGLLHQLQK